MKKAKIKVGLIIDEFFGAVGTAYGGYGFLARRHIAKYIPNSEIQIDVLLGRGKNRFTAEHYSVDEVNVYRLPKRSWFAKYWLKKQDYDIYLSIELVDDYVLKHESNPNKKLILWIQDPRPMYEWDEINTVKLFPETCYYNQRVYDLVHEWYLKNRIKFISQGYFLNQKAIDLYQLDNNVNIQYLPNPIDIDFDFDIHQYEKKI
ncbi:glycosyl transferase [Moraxella oblonga]|uniref:glycosyl transferase n=1 Tax=Moraxella oblonga TaxID=200413 RepID=UPI000A451024|nr:glycosyl transferase [Moraxella oblonga]